MIPTYLPPHKAGGQLAGGCHRLNMCRLAFEGDPVCRVSDIELRRGGKSYTVDTLKQLTRENPSDTFYLIMGSDMFLSLTQWYDWQRIILDAVICAGARSPGQMQALRAEAARLERLGAQIELVALEPLPFSSTQVRARVQAGESLAGFVPPKVAGLYHGKQAVSIIQGAVLKLPLRGKMQPLILNESGARHDGL